MHHISRIFVFIFTSFIFHSLRLFSHISMNWKGQPLTSHDVMVNLIGGTKTKAGLKVKAKIDKRKYPIEIKVSDVDMRKINLKKEKFHGEWNYRILRSTS